MICQAIIHAAARSANSSADLLTLADRLETRAAELFNASNAHAVKDRPALAADERRRAADMLATARALRTKVASFRSKAA